MAVTYERHDRRIQFAHRDDARRLRGAPVPSRILQRIEEERQRFDELLHVILPQEIIAELKNTGTVQPREYPNVAVLFADIANFTPYCETHTPDDILANLQALIEAYENLALRYGLQKIKTMGDSSRHYTAVTKM